MKGLRAARGQDRHVGLWIGEQEQTDPTDPQHPPCHAVRAVLVGDPTAYGAQHAAGERKARGQQRGSAYVEAKFADVVLNHPKAHRHVATKYDRVVLAELPDLGVLQGNKLLAPRDFRVHQVGRIGIAAKPEQNCCAEHDGRVDLRYHCPAEGHDKRRRDELVDGRAGVARAEDTHRKTLAISREPACNIGGAHGERAARKSDEKAEHEVLPILGCV